MCDLEAMGAPSIFKVSLFKVIRSTCWKKNGEERDVLHLKKSSLDFTLLFILNR